MTPITITIAPSCDDDGRRKTGRYDAAVGRTLVTSSTTALLDAARVLAAEGVPAHTRLAMRHAGADHDALTSTVGAAARLRVQEGSSGKPVFRPWVPDGRCDGPSDGVRAPHSAETGSAAVTHPPG